MRIAIILLLFTMYLTSCSSDKSQTNDCDYFPPPKVPVDIESLRPHIFAYNRDEHNQYLRSWESATFLAIFDKNSVNFIANIDTATTKVMIGSQILNPNQYDSTKTECANREPIDSLNLGRPTLDTSLNITVLQNSNVVKSWRLTYRFRDSMVPDFALETIGNQLTPKFYSKVGTKSNSVFFRSNDTYCKLNANQVVVSGNTTAVYLDSSMFGSLRKECSFETRSENKYAICIANYSEILKITLDGVPQEARYIVCNEIPERFIKPWEIK